ncbi:uroporphyrinogen-III methyltransferase [Vibrio ishigakensis]|uniref:Uroporphyrinogen-III methyltransferase n=1 Tax=Vibrio ishigakensis TaxID=1481914 RepID=A0A0B8P0R2_9VIBR|nr:uroporphyrinogen-III methyltransferase [Vibrio ishigakensis]
MVCSGCTFITAHSDKALSINWKALAELNQTLVIYMGLTKTELITSELSQAGMDAATPVAIIENGCTPEQRIFTGQLHELTALKQHNQIKSPALIVVGEVVTIANQMQWLEQLSERHTADSTFKLTA